MEFRPEYDWEGEDKPAAMVFLTNKLRIRLTDPRKRPIPNGKCRVATDQATIYACDADGIVEIPLRDRGQTSLDLEWGSDDTATPDGGNPFPWSNTFSFPIRSAEDDVCAKRLYHLGFLGDALPDQVRAYQNYFGLPATGLLGDIRDKLVDWHDGGEMPGLAGPAASTAVGAATGPLTVANTPQAIKDYLAREAKFNVLDMLESLPARLLIFGETHYTQDPFKAFLFSELVYRARTKRPAETRFHASERIPNTDASRAQISGVIAASGPQQIEDGAARLDEQLRRFLPVLAGANDFPGRRYGFLPCDQPDLKGENERNQMLFESFNDAARKCPDVPPDSIAPSLSRGNYLLGAYHAARRSRTGSAVATACGRFVAAGWPVHAIRLTVPHDSGQFPDEKQDFQLIEGADTEVIMGLPIFEEISNGRSFFADLSKPDSPFSRLAEAGFRNGAVPFNQMFDAILHLGPIAKL